MRRRLEHPRHASQGLGVLAGLLTGLVLVQLISPAAVLAAPLATPSTSAKPVGVERPVALQLTPPMTSSWASRPLPPDDWDRRENRILFWTGAFMLPASAGVAVGGVLLLKKDGKPACTPPADQRCERVYATSIPGWASIGLAVGGALGGIMMMWLYRDHETSVALSPAGLSGRF